MAEYITKEQAIKIIEQRQKELCPVGRYGRNYVYGSDREKYDAWEEIIDEIENMDADDVAEVRHGRWIDKGWDGDFSWQIDGCGSCWRVYECSECQCKTSAKTDYCPNCGARMDKEATNNDR